MEVETAKSTCCCPHCSGVLDESSEGLRCNACRRQFPIVEGIPVLAGAPVHATDSLSEAEVSALLDEMDTCGWIGGLREELLRLDGARGQTGLAEFADPRGLLGAMMVGGPHHASVLCLGCAVGAVPFALAARFDRITICDLSLGRLRVLQKRSTQEGHPNLEFVCGGDTAYVPFPAGEFGLVLVDAMALPDVCLRAPSFWCEVARVLRADGRCFVSALNGHDPRRLLGRVEGYSGIGFLTPRFLRGMLHKAGLKCLGAYGLLPDNRTPQVLFDLSSRQLSRTIDVVPRTCERLESSLLHNTFFAPAFGLAAGNGAATRHTQSDDGRRTFLEGIVSSAQEALRDAQMPDAILVARRITVRRSGRVVIVANFEGGARRPVVIKVPCGPSLEQRDERNADALRLLHASDAVPAEVKRLVPRHLARGSFGGQPYFVEDAIGGIETGPLGGGSPVGLKLPTMFRRGAKLPVATQFADALLKLHRATARVVTLSEDHLVPVRQAVMAARTLTLQAEPQRIWDTIQGFLERELLGRQLPLVWSHGDAGCNFLQDGNGNLSGIIDWETFDENGLALYDLVLLSVARKKQRHDVGWAWLRWALAGEERVFFEGLPIEDYLRALKIDRELIPALALAAWVQYVAHRLPKRGCDPGWIRGTVLRVLELCAKML